MTKALIKKIIKLWKQGRNIWEISQITGCSESTVLGVVNNPQNNVNK